MSNSIFNALNSKEDKLQNKLDKIYDKENSLREERDTKINSALKGYFEGTEGIETNLEGLLYSKSTTYMTISCKGEAFEKEIWNEKKQDYIVETRFRNYELCTVYVNEGYRNQEESKFTNMGIGTYSTSDRDSDINLDRFMFNGQVAMIIKDFKDDILADMNSIYESYSKKVSKQLDLKRELRTAIEKVKEDRKNFKKDNLISDLEKGIEILDDNTVQIQVRFDDWSSNITKMKITRKTYSGKSVDLEVSKKGRRWNNETEAYDSYEYADKLENVRVSKLEDALMGRSNSWKVNA